MDNPPPYDDNRKLPNWSSDEKNSFRGKGRDISDNQEDDNESSHQKKQLQIEGGHSASIPHNGRQLTLSGARCTLATDGPRMTVSQNAPTQRISASYFQPQAALDQPLDLNLRQYGVVGRDALVVRNPENRLAPFRPPPGRSQDEQLALVLGENPDIEVDDALKMLEAAKSEIEDVSDMPDDTQLIPYANRSPANAQVNTSPNRNIMVGRQSDLITVQKQSNDEATHHLQSLQQNSRARSKISHGGRASSITPSESASQIPKTAAEQEDEDFQLALEISRQDRGSSQQRPLGETSGARAWEAGRHLNTSPAPASTVSMSSLLESSARSRVLGTNQAASAPVATQPLWAPGTGSSLLGGRHNALLPRTNIAVEQQRLADLAAIQNLQAERSAQRNMVESDHYSQLSSPQEDRALKAQLALAREDLRDSRLATHMTALSLNQNRLSSMRRFADEDEIDAAQRRVDGEARRRFQLAQAESRKQESMEKARLRDRRRQVDQDELREQEERDRAFALELQQMQHDQVIEKVDAFGRNTSQPTRRNCPIHPGRQSLEMRSSSNIDGDHREITYEAAPSTVWVDEDDQLALQGWDDYERAGSRPRRGSSTNSSLGRGRARGRKK